MGGGRYRQVKRVLGVGVACVGGKILSDEWSEFNRKLSRNFSSMETDLVRPELKELAGLDKISHFSYDLAFRLGIIQKKTIDRFLKDMNSVCQIERNDSVKFIKDDLKWLDNHPDSDHLRSRISRSRIIHALSRLETFHSELFIDPINPNLGKKLSRRLLSIFNQLPSTKLLSDEDLFTPCVKYFTETAIEEIKSIWEKIENSESKKNHNIGDDFTDYAIIVNSKIYDKIHEDAGILMLLKALRRYCEDPENYKLINSELLFETLIDVVLNDHSPNAAKSLEMKQIALRCLANLACDPILKPLFIQLGVHKILRSCIDDHQIYFDDDEVCFNKLLCCFQAIRALANLDIDSEEGTFEDGVFRIYPKGRVTEELKNDVIFVHGLGGGVASTWTTKTEIHENGEFVSKRVNWVDQWVARDLNKRPRSCRILSVDYESAIVYDRHQCPFEREKRSITTIATDLGAKLKKAGVGKRKTVFVCYSMGGLVTKKMLEIFPELGSQLEGVVFLGTPHFGSPIAKLFTHETEALGKLTTYLKDYNIVTPEVIMLGGLEEDLYQLNDQFLKTVKDKNVKVMSWGEELPSNYGVMVHIVPPNTANPGVGSFAMSKKDHDGMVMPIDEVDPIYSRTLDFIRTVLSD